MKPDPTYLTLVYLNCPIRVLLRYTCIYREIPEGGEDCAHDRRRRQGNCPLKQVSGFGLIEFPLCSRRNLKSVVGGRCRQIPSSFANNYMH